MRHCNTAKAVFSIFILILICGIVSGQSANKLMIDPRYVRGGAISELIDEVTFIPLETSKESTFGIAQRIRVGKDHFVFYDVTTDAIFIFFKDGKFRSKINELPGMNKESTRQLGSFSNFTLNPYSESIYLVYDSGDKINSKKLAIFDMDGKLLEAVTMNRSFNDLSTAFTFLDSTTTLFTNKRGLSTAKYSFHIVKNFDKITGDSIKINPSDPLTKSWANDYLLQASSANESLWTREYDHEFYIFDNKSKPSKYRFLLPAEITLDPEFYSDTSIIGNRMKSNEYLSEHKDKVSVLGNLRRINDWMSFTAIRYNMAGPNDVYLYNSKSNDLFSFGKIIPDSLSYSLPIFKVGAIVVGSEGDYLYISFPSFSFYNALKNSTNKQWESNEVLNTYFKTQNQKSNPVLVRLKLKKGSGY